MRPAIDWPNHADVSRGSIAPVARARIGVVGEFQPNFDPHTAIDTAVEHALAAHPSRPPIALEWVATSDAEHISEEELAAYAGWWIAPGSPYRSMNGAENHPLCPRARCSRFRHVRWVPARGPRIRVQRAGFR